jgi:hypothetical protein
MGASERYLVTIVDSNGRESTSEHITDDNLDSQFKRVLDELGVADADGELIGDSDIDSITIRRV